MVFAGLGYAIYASVLWPSVSILIDEELLGLAFGILYSLLNLAEFVFPIILGYVYDETNAEDGYFWFSFFFVGNSVVALIFGIVLYIKDTGNKSFLTHKSLKISLMTV